MDVKDKIIKALHLALKDAYILLDSDDGISGFVVSPQFEGLSALERQRVIDKTLRKPPAPLTPAERRDVRLIAALTPLEYDAVGAYPRPKRQGYRRRHS